MSSRLTKLTLAPAGTSMGVGLNWKVWMATLCSAGAVRPSVMPTIPAAMTHLACAFIAASPVAFPPLTDVYGAGARADCCAGRGAREKQAGKLFTIGRAWLDFHVRGAAAIGLVTKDFPGRVVPARPHDAPSRMSSRAAQVEPSDGGPVIRVPGDRTQKEELIERHGPLEDISPGEAEALLDV